MAENASKVEAPEKPRREVVLARIKASKVVDELAPLVQERVGAWFHSLRPQNYYQQWLLDCAATTSLQIDRAQRVDRRLRDQVILRAEVCWDQDRRVEVELLGAKLADQPAVVVEQLKATPHGCDWLIKRWSMLAYSADISEGRGWTPEEQAMAFDMLGAPEAFRKGKPGLELDDEGRVVDSGDDPASVARREIARLKATRVEVAGLDEAARFLASGDLSDASSPEIKQHRRYESTLHRRLQWFLGQFKIRAADPRQLHPSLRPKYVSVDEPEPVAVVPTPVEAVVPEPVVEAEVKVEAALVVDAKPTVEVSRSRQEQRLDRAESRRAAKRRKLERLRA